MNHTLLLYSDPIFGDVFATSFAFLFIIGILAALVLPKIFFLRSIQRTFMAISPQNRAMDPAQVWLCMIPLFGAGWNFYVLEKLSDSIQAEMRMRGANLYDRPLYGVGLTYCILWCTCHIPCFNYLAAIPALVLFIIYWVKIVDYKSQLDRMPMNNRRPESNIFGHY